jgi:hypothetical protein
MNYPQSLYNFTKNKNEFFAKIVDPNILSPEKFLFNKDYKLNIKRIVDVTHGDQKLKKQIKSFKDFNNSTYISLRNFDLQQATGLLIPVFNNCSFKCMSCNKNYDKRIRTKCCTMNAPILITSAELYSIYIPTAEDLQESLTISKSSFLELHFPDLLDNILLR